MTRARGTSAPTSTERMTEEVEITEKETKIEDLHRTKSTTNGDLTATMAEETETQDNLLETKVILVAPETK